MDSGARVPAIRCRTCRRNRRAHANSVARIARPIGMTTKAGPGSTMRAIPNSTTEPPMTNTVIFLAVERNTMVIDRVSK